LTPLSPALPAPTLFPYTPLFRSRAHAAAIAALLVGAGIPALLTFDAWTTQSAKSLDPNSRDILLREGLELYETSPLVGIGPGRIDRKSTRLNSSHEWISYAVFCL